MIGKFASIYQQLTAVVSAYSNDVVLLLLRLLGARVFLESGMTKWDGWFDFNELKYDLFLYEFFCPDPPREGALQLCNAETLDYDSDTTVAIVEWLALSAGIMEVVLPVLLILGLFTRLGALGLIGMSLFIQIAVYPSWDHWWNPAVWWVGVLLAVFSFGPGRLSVDRLLGLDAKRR